MKKIIAYLVFVVSTIVAAEQFTITTNGLLIYPNEAYMGKAYFYAIDNISTNDIFVRANVSTAIVSNMIPLKAGTSYSPPFREGRRGELISLFVICTNATSAVNVGFDN
jgi:hypothetical protein